MLMPSASEAAQSRYPGLPPRNDSRVPQEGNARRVAGKDARPASSCAPHCTTARRTPIKGNGRVIRLRFGRVDPRSNARNTTRDSPVFHRLSALATASQLSLRGGRRRSRRFLSLQFVAQPAPPRGDLQEYLASLLVVHYGGLLLALVRHLIALARRIHPGVAPLEGSQASK